MYIPDEVRPLRPSGADYEPRPGGAGTISLLSRDRVRLAAGLAAGTILGAVMLVALLLLMSAAVPG